jgi:UDP-N-acetyl-D-glucosamine dehydrogenase
LDFFLAFSPDWEDAGNQNLTTVTIPKVVGSDDQAGSLLAYSACDSFGGKTVPSSSPGTAEAVKITQNIFRAGNVALANDLEIDYNKLGMSCRANCRWGRLTCAG